SGGLTTIAQTAEYARLENEVLVCIRHISQKVKSHHGFHGLVVDRCAYRYRSASAGWDYYLIAIDALLVFRPSAWLEACIAQERIVKQIAVSVIIFEARQSRGIVSIDHLAFFVDGQTLFVGYKVQRAGVRQIQSRTTVTQGRYGLELHGIRISGARRDLPIASGKVGVDHFFRCKVSHPNRYAIPDIVLDWQFLAGGQVVGMDCQPGGATFWKSRGKIMAAASVGNGDGKGYRTIFCGGLGPMKVHAEHVPQPVPGQPRLLRIRAFAFNMGPEATRIGALLIG